MPTIENRLLISGAIEEVFDLTQDYSKRLDWDPYLSQAELIGDPQQAIGPGTRAYCRSKKGIGMTVEYVTFNRPHATAVKLCSDFLVFQNFAGSWRFVAKAANQTEVIFRYNFLTKWWFTPFTPLIRLVLMQDINKRLAGLQHHFMQPVS